MKSSSCRRHPRQMGVGVCALCLKERLLALIEEEDQLESARDCLGGAEMSPAHNHSMGFTAVPSFSHDSSGGTVPARRHVMEYSTQNVKQVAAFYLNKHQSLTSSPLHPQPPIKTASPPPSIDKKSRKSSYFDSKSSYLNSNSSLFTSTKADNVASDTPRKKRSSLWSLLNRHADESVSKDSIKLKQQRRSMSSSYITHIDGDGSSYKLSHTSSLREVHNSISKADTSLLSSPHVASPGRSSANMPSLSSKHIPHRTLRGEKTIDEKVTSRGRQLYALSSMNHGLDEDRRHHSSSWISSLFSRRAKRSTSISAASDAHAYVSHSSQPRSAAASPDITPRRKSVSFLDDEAYKSSENMGFKSPQSTSSKGLPHTDLKSPNHLINPVDYAKSVGLEGRHGASSDVNNGRRASFSDCNDLNSPRLKLASLLTKRRSSVSIDCSRDVKVSPAPSLSTPRGDNHHSYGGNHTLSNDTYGDNYESYHGDYTNNVAGSKYFKHKMKLSVCSESEEDKSQYNMSGSKSWSTAWSKTLSPMLGLRSKKKKSNSNSRIKESMDNHPTNHKDYGGQDTPSSDTPSSVPPRQSEDFLVPVRRPVNLAPNPVNTLDHKCPPQQYSFLRKDYSAFSFYFSPRHQQRSFTDNHNYSRYKNGSDHGSCLKSRHSVDGNSWSSYPSLFKKSSPAGAAGAGGGDRNGRGRF